METRFNNSIWSAEWSIQLGILLAVANDREAFQERERKRKRERGRGERETERDRER